MSRVWLEAGRSSFRPTSLRRHFPTIVIGIIPQRSIDPQPPFLNPHPPTPTTITTTAQGDQGHPRLPPEGPEVRCCAHCDSKAPWSRRWFEWGEQSSSCMLIHPTPRIPPHTTHTHTRKDAKSVKVKKANNVTKFKIRCSRVRFGFEVSDRDP